MNDIYLSICFGFSTIFSFCQTEKIGDFNFGFEKIENNQASMWDNFGSSYYTISIDSLNRYSGKYSASIEYNGTSVDYKAWSYTIPSSYEGKKIKLSGFIKTDSVTEGWAGLWMRIDPQIAFDNMKKNGIKGTTDWQKYEITLELNPNMTKQIVVGGLLVGKGKMWIDDLLISIDGKNINSLKPISPKEFKADKDKEFNSGSKISSIDLSDSKIQDLVLLGKTWGLLKYYHPVIASGEYNWDYELFRILPKIIETKSQFERNKILSTWIESLGKIENGKVKKNKKETVKISPDLAWTDDTILGDKLLLQFLSIKNAKREDKNYYIELVPGVCNPEFKNENSYKEMKYPDAGFRLLCLFRYWNIIQYYFPYKYLIEENWNNVLPEFIPYFLNATNELEYKKAVLSLIARVHDTHANIWGKDSILTNYIGINYAPIEIGFVENKAIVTGYFDDSLGKYSGIKIGDIIENINDKSVDEIVQEKLPFTPASNYPTQLRNIARNLLRTNDSLISISYVREKLKTNVQIQCFSSDKLNLYQRLQKKDTCYKNITPDIGYLYPGNIKNEYLPIIIPEILGKKGLIIDFRCYPSDFIVFSLSEYLLPKKSSFVKFSNGSIISPGLFTMTDNLSVGKKNRNFYKGKVVIIINETTQSSAEYHSMAFRTAPKATVIGSMTAGADGNVSRFMLPGGISTMISGIGVYYPDGKETQRIGIVPDIEVKPTIRGITENKDELLEKAIEIINAN